MMIFKRLVRNLFMKYVMKGFVVPREEREIPKADWEAAMKDVYTSKALQKVITIRVANLMRENLYANSMEEASFWRGQVFALRWLVKSSKNLHDEGEKPQTTPLT